ncbi:MAG: RimK family alpha-L-glutamate ligase, partial [Clostridia bacterium]
YGSFGMQVYLAKTRAELENLYARLINKPHLYQQFIASSSGMDTRMIVIGGKYFSAMKRVSKSDFRSNIELGGVGEEFCPTQSFIDTAERVAKKLGLDYCGIDILFGEHNEPIVCEVNSNAFFIEMERIARVNVAGRYASYIVGKVYK